MYTNRTTKFVSAAFISLLLAACGGGENLVNEEENPDGVDTTSPVAIGNGSGSSFEEGEIAVGIGSGTLSAGGTTSLTVNIVSSTNTLVTTATEITFNSACIAAGEAIVTVGGTTTNKVTAENGEATVTYKANGCVGDDAVTATARLGSTNRSARATLSIEADTVQAIEFVDALPTQISLKGTGGAETSTVRFKITGSTSAPIKDVSVSMSLSTEEGGLCLATTGSGTACAKTITGTTDKNGIVSAIVQAGTKPTAVRVTATDIGSGVSTQSNNLYVSTGIPDQNSMSFSTSLFNPPGWNHDGEIVDLTIRMADAFNNPPPDGTAVTFTTEGGKIDSGCTTVDGACTVKWTSQSPRPSDGRVTIIARALGNESFTDKNGNGLYDDSDTFNTHVIDDPEYDPSNDSCKRNSPLSTAASTLGDNPCDDLVEAYLDENENGQYDAGEEYTELVQDGTHTSQDGKYNGVLCNTAGGANCTKDSITIRDDIVIVMSSDQPLTAGGRLPGQDSNYNLVLGQTFTFNVTLSDIHGNAMPKGTTISINSASASDVTISHNMPSSGVANTTSPTTFSVTLKSTSETKLASGSFDIQVNAPDLTTTYSSRINNP